MKNTVRQPKKSPSDAAGGLAEQLAEDLPGEVAAEHLLAALVGNDVADEGHGERNDPAGGERRDAKRASASAVSDCASPQSAHQSRRDSAQATATVRYLPKRSPIGPMTSCTEPCVSA